MDLSSHIKVLFSILLGLGVSHILRGLARIVQHPKQYCVYWVHLVWSLFLFLYLIHFWWWEFRLRQVTWSFPVYFFVALYATLIYLLCTLLFPDEMSDYKSFREYFYLRKSWFFSLLALLFVADIGDTLASEGPGVFQNGWTPILLPHYCMHRVKFHRNQGEQSQISSCFRRLRGGL